MPDEIWLLDAGLFAVAITAAAVVGAIFVVRLGTDRKEENAKEESEIEQQDLSEGPRSTALVQRSQSNRPPPAISARFAARILGSLLPEMVVLRELSCRGLAPHPATTGQRDREHRAIG